MLNQIAEQRGSDRFTQHAKGVDGLRADQGSLLVSEYFQQIPHCVGLSLVAAIGVLLMEYLMRKCCYQATAIKSNMHDVTFISCLTAFSPRGGSS